MASINLTRLKVFELICAKNIRIGYPLELAHLLRTEHQVIINEKCEAICKDFSHKLKQRWQTAGRNKAHFLKKFEKWLECLIQFDVAIQKHESECSPSSSQFSMYSNRHKRRLTEDLRSKHSTEELLFASKTKFNAEKKIHCAKVINILEKNVDKAKKIVQFCEGTLQPSSNTISKEKGLAIFLSLNLSASKYNMMRRFSIEGGGNLYPSYYQIIQAKNECYPPSTSIYITETTVQIELQALLDHTVSRILKIADISDGTEGNKLSLISKWGMDGSSQVAFKQSFQGGDDTISKPLDSSIFTTYLVPLKLFSVSRTIWENPRPNSTFFCRPVRFQFVPESEEIITEEHKRMSAEIENLSETETDGVKIKHTLTCTMIDGKVCNAVTNCKATQRCFICGAIGKEFNDIPKIFNRPVNEANCTLGLSTLHALIRTMEFLLKLAYKLGTEKWSTYEEPVVEKKKTKLSEAEKEEQARIKKALEEKCNAEMAVKKKDIQEKFRQKYGILLDFVKQGAGSTNDGNSARKFFEDPEFTAEVTGIDAEIIRRFKILLQAITCGKEVDPDKYHAYARITAEKFVSLYKWCNMSPTVHKLLVHGSLIIRKALLPIGNLSEEASEARNKESRKIRKDNTRKCNRVICNKDLVQGLLTTSDPLISSLRYKFAKTKKKKELDSETNDLLVIRPHAMDDSGLGAESDGAEESEEEEEEEDEEEEDEESEGEEMDVDEAVDS